MSYALTSYRPPCPLGPDLLRLIQAPAGYVDGLNLFEYVAANPVSLTDPEGLKLAWHHLFPRDVFTEDFFKKHGIKGFNINAREYGWIMDAKRHSKLHSAKWNDAWFSWINLQKERGQPITKERLIARMRIMKRSSRFAPMINMGFQAAVDHDSTAWRKFTKSLSGAAAQSAMRKMATKRTALGTARRAAAKSPKLALKTAATAITALLIVPEFVEAAQSGDRKEMLKALSKATAVTEIGLEVFLFEEERQHDMMMIAAHDQRPIPDWLGDFAGTKEQFNKQLHDIIRAQRIGGGDPFSANYLDDFHANEARAFRIWYDNRAEDNARRRAIYGNTYAPIPPIPTEGAMPWAE